jgi:very-short-patch-repair endonuclease
VGMADFKPRYTFRARELRNAATPAERELWKHVSKSQIAGAKFSRQMPVGPYFADFLCRQCKLIIEIDGYSHDLTIERDSVRTRYLEAQGYTVMRFSNAEVLGQTEGVIWKISQVLADMPTPSPSRKREGDRVASAPSFPLPPVGDVGVGPVSP